MDVQKIIYCNKLQSDLLSGFEFLVAVLEIRSLGNFLHFIQHFKIINQLTSRSRIQHSTFIEKHKYI